MAENELGEVGGTRACLRSLWERLGPDYCDLSTLQEVFGCIDWEVAGNFVGGHPRLGWQLEFHGLRCRAHARALEGGGPVGSVLEPWLLAVAGGVSRGAELGGVALDSMRELAEHAYRVGGPPEWSLANCIRIGSHLSVLAGFLVGLFVSWCLIRGIINGLYFAWVAGGYPDDVERPGLVLFFFLNPHEFRRRLSLYLKAVSAKSDKLPEALVVMDKIRYDSKGPYVLMNLSGTPFVARFTSEALGVALTASRTTSSSLLSNDLDGKEAALLDSREPTPGPLPAYALRILVGTRLVGLANRLGEKHLTIARHVHEILLEHPGEVYLSNGKLSLPLETLKESFQVPKNADIVVYDVDTAVFSLLQTKVGRVGFAAPGPCQVAWVNKLNVPVVSIGRIANPNSGLKGILAHNCFTEPGSSGAAVTQGGYVVGIHSGADKANNPTENLAVSLRLFRSKLEAPGLESHYEDKHFQKIDPLDDKVIDACDKMERKFHGRGKIAGLLDNVSTFLRSEHYPKEEQSWSVKEAISFIDDLLDSPELLDRETTELFRSWKRKRLEGAAVPAATDLVAEALSRGIAQPEAADIKGPSSLTSSTTSSTKEKDTKMALDSNMLDPPKAPAQPRDELKPRALPASDTLSALARLERENQSLRDKLASTSQSKLSSLPTPTQDPKQSSPPSSTKQPASSNPSNAPKKASKQDLKARSTTTQ